MQWAAWISIRMQAASGTLQWNLTWAVTNGIVDGLDGKLAPQAASTRAQIATVIMRCETADLA